MANGTASGCGSRIQLISVLLTLTFVGLISGPLFAQPAAPPPPAKYAVELRFRINSPRDQRVGFYREMIAGLKKLNFEFDPPLDKLPPTDPENTHKDRIKGSVPGKNGIRIAQVPFVETVLLVPSTFKLPDNPESPIHVQLELSAGFSYAQQREFHKQVRTLLSLFGFRESVGYYTRGASGRPYSRLRGSIQREQIPILLKDLRSQPSGWFEPKIPRSQLPAPFAFANPIRTIVVLPDPAPELAGPVEFKGPGKNEVIGPELQKIVTADEVQTTPRRIEVVFKYQLDNENTVRIAFQKAAPNLTIEGFLGNTVAGVFGRRFVDESGFVRTNPLKVGKQIQALAALDFVESIRIPGRAGVQVAPSVQFPADNASVLEKSGLSELHKAGHRGKGVTIAIVDSDFGDWQAMVAAKRLPKNTSLIDLTIERNANLFPDPFKTTLGAAGHGTQCAMAAALAAPDATMLLVRVDPGAPHMLVQLTGFLNGTATFSPSLLRRHDEVQAGRIELVARHKEILFERKLVLDNFEDEKEDIEKYQMLGVVRTWVFTTREWHYRRFAEFKAFQQKHRDLENRLAKYIDGLRRLRNVDIVACPLVWNEGYPLGGRSALTQAIDQAVRPKVTGGGPPRFVLPSELKTPKSSIWFQAAGNTRGQTWNDGYHDRDGNGFMEFADPRKTKLPKNRWTSELSFLGWLPYGKNQVEDLPQGKQLRVCLQWTEPHEPDYFILRSEKDRYQRPLAELKIIVVRQRDAAAAALPQDAFEVVAQSRGLPKRLANDPSSSTYELQADWITAKPGPYAVLVQRAAPSRWEIVDAGGVEGLRFNLRKGLTPTGIVPLGAPTLASLQKTWELRPRLFVRGTNGLTANTGRPIFRDFFTDRGSVGIPADGRSIIAVGAARLDGKAAIYGAMGPPPNMDLFVSPRLFTYDGIGGDKAATGPAFGTSLAASYAAGLTAAAISSGISDRQLRNWLLETKKSRILKVPN